MKLYRDIKENYTIVSNEIIKHGLSLQAIGLYMYIISKPDGWNFSVNGTATQVKNGVESINSAIHELEQAGFLYRRQTKNSNRFGNMEWCVTDKPRQNDTKQQDFPLTGKPLNGNTQNVKSVQVNTKEVSTKKVNTKRECYSSLTSLTETDFTEIADKYRVTTKTVMGLYDSLQNWCLSKGKRYKNYKAALMNWVRMEIARNPNLIIKVAAEFKPNLPDVSEEQRLQNLQRIQEMRSKLFGVN